MPVSFWNPVLLSLQTAAAALIFVTIFGVIIARVMARRSFKGKIFIETILLLPTVLPPTVIGFLLIIAFGTNGFLGRVINFLFQSLVMFTWTAAVIAAFVVAFPFMYQSVKTGLQQVEVDIEHAARLDGAGEWKLFFFVSLPLCIRSVVSGVILSFARALGEFGATFMFAGNLPGITQTIPIAVYTAFEGGRMEIAWAWVLVIVALSFLMLFSVRRFAA
ncbi:molybdate ABC transporter permease subunit [Alteribacillus sp. HJP-4]|uniref:molybdate ABC transporter permease subunit n=1 Tax=Alteribacillus sp. HJP-4 TaxID=2775394 RepID=UPI0035CCD657